MEKLYLLALQNIRGIGAVRAKKLVAHCGSAEAVFHSTEQKLQKISGINENITKEIINSSAYLKDAEAELNFCEKNDIEVITYYEDKYPILLKQISDAPLVLFKKGNLNLNEKTSIAIVGTRDATQYGRQITEKFAAAFVQANLNVVSGLAVGIDITAHKAVLEHNGSTTCVLAHGLDRIYPSHHKNIAQSMLEKGAWLTEYPSKTQPDAVNFPERNRIIAGMCIATLVVEARPKGGALITARLAFSENRDVYAIPGDIERNSSKGTNDLIKQNIAKLVTEPEDILKDLNLIQILKKETKPVLTTLPLTHEEQQIVNLLKEKERVIDEILIHIDLNPSRLFSILLEMEFKGILVQLPGKKFKLV